MKATGRKIKDSEWFDADADADPDADTEKALSEKTEENFEK